ncbi:uncharacterized protein FTOL_08342 [Fusarium torulosum]|uniref:Uncharacterized protein n=1 Tax=Fusarium torulosum TaxID=33205 RepID=A0AAE8MF49_9HYPO|nr:uncharacterized protein FTOL_08342 [Fusarium torulosum]
MSQNYRGGGGGDQGHRQEPGFSRDHGGQNQREPAEAIDFWGPPLGYQQEPVYQYGGRYLQTEQDAYRQRDEPPAFHNNGQPVPGSWEEDGVLFGPYEGENVRDWRDRREPPPEQILRYEYRGSQRPLEQSSRYEDRGNQPLPLTPGQLYGRDQRGFAPPGQSSNFQHEGFSYHGSLPYMPPVRVPQAQNRPPSQAPNRASTYQSSNTGSSQTSLPNQNRGVFMGHSHRANAGGQSKNPNPNSRKRKRKHTTQSTETLASANDSAKKIKLEDDNSNTGHGFQKSLHSGKKGGVNVGNLNNTKATTDASTKPTIPGHTGEAMQTSSLREITDAKKQRLQVFKVLRAIVPGSAFKLPDATEEELAEIEAYRVIQEQKRIRVRGQMASEKAVTDTTHDGTVPKKVEMDVCGNCTDRSHVVADCNKPQSDGLIHGCAICNAADHSTWGCQRLPRGNGTTLEQLKELVFKRANRPPLHGKYWYPLMYSYMQAHPDTEVPGLPWTKEFSQPYHSSSMLQHKLRFEMDNNEEVTVDPKTSTWQAAVAHYGIPHQRRTKSKAKH